MAVTPPNSADVRKARARAGKAASARFDAVRTPLLAWLGAGDLALHKLGELPGELRTRLSADEVRKRVDTVSGQARRAYDELADRGEDTLERIRQQPRVARVLGEARDASGRLDRRVDRTVDSVHDASEEALSELSTRTRSVGERAALGAQRSAGTAAAGVREAGDEVAESVEAAGDETAHVARSASRKAANRASAPRRPSTATRTRKGQTGR
jgi:heparin binding hemagglutinin HbhA